MNKRQFQLVKEIIGESDDDTVALRHMSEEAISYITAHPWCPPIKAQYLAYGVGGVIGLFYFEFAFKINGIDDELWVVVGDLPSAYMVVDDRDDFLVALEKYCELMSDWAEAVCNDASALESVFPVEAKPSVENADALLERIAFIRNEILIPEQLKGDLGGRR